MAHNQHKDMRVFIGTGIECCILNSSRVFTLKHLHPIVPGLLKGESRIKFVNLPDPATGVSTLFSVKRKVIFKHGYRQSTTAGTTSDYLLTGNTLHEINIYSKKFSSWFIDNQVISDGSLYVATPVDLLFLLLPALQKSQSSGNFCDIEHIVECTGSSYQSAHMLSSLITAQSSLLSCICDTKQSGGQTFYRLNDDKTINWLKLKVKSVKEALVVPHSPFATMTDTSLSEYAAGLLSEYLSCDWSTKLSAALNLPLESGASEGGMKGDGPAGYNPDVPYYPPVGNDAKRPRFDPKQAAKLKAAEARKEAKTAKRMKEAEGMRKLSSFFSKNE